MATRRASTTTLVIKCWASKACTCCWMERVMQWQKAQTRLRCFLCGSLHKVPPPSVLSDKSTKRRWTTSSGWQLSQELLPKLNQPSAMQLMGCIQRTSQYHSEIAFCHLWHVVEMTGERTLHTSSKAGQTGHLETADQLAFLGLREKSWN